MRSAFPLLVALTIAAAAKVGVAANDARDSNDWSCCALHQDGRFFSNVTLLGHVHKKRMASHGYIAADPTHPDHPRYVINFGSSDPHHGSAGGWYGFACPKNANRHLAVAWTPDECIVYPIAQVPKMCFGSGSHYPLHIGWERMGSNHDLLRFRARGFPAFVSVHWISCMPYIGHVKTWDNVTDVRLVHDNGPHPHLRTHADDGDASGHADDGATHDQQHLLVRPKWQSLKGMVFRDPEVVVPDMRKFGFPRRCAKSVEKKIKDICDSGSMHDGAHDVDDGTPFVIV